MTTRFRTKGVRPDTLSGQPEDWPPPVQRVAERLAAILQDGIEFAEDWDGGATVEQLAFRLPDELAEVRFQGRRCYDAAALILERMAQAGWVQAERCAAGLRYRASLHAVRLSRPQLSFTFETRTEDARTITDHTGRVKVYTQPVGRKQTDHRCLCGAQLPVDLRPVGGKCYHCMTAAEKQARRLRFAQLRAANKPRVSEYWPFCYHMAA